MAARRVLLVTLTATLILTGATAFAQPALAQETAPPPDPDDDIIGWENGYWYNETLAITTDDGLTDEELDAVVGRAMARVEKTRNLEFKEEVPVRIIDRETYRNRTDQAFENVTAAERLHHNTKYEALFMVNQSANALELLRANQGGSVVGFYSIAEKELVIVSDNPETLELDELTLAHELVHALQDQHFDLSRYDRKTTEEHNAVNGIVEGDANYVQHRYEASCEDQSWGACVIPDGPRSGGGVAHIGLFIVSFQPYSDGPTFVEHVFQTRGWEGVNAVYEEPPASTEQVIHPRLYGVDEPAEVSITDRSNDNWHVLELENSINYAEFGEAGIFSMFLYPGFASNQQTQLIPLTSFFTNQDLTPYNYESEYSQGWDGDKLLPYVTNESDSVRDSGYVWKTVWDTEDDAREFTEGYRALLEYHDATETTSDTFIIPVQSGFTGAIHVEHQEDTVTIVKAPTVSQLNSIRAGTTRPPSLLPNNGDIPDPGADLQDPTDPANNGQETPSPVPGDGEMTSPNSDAKGGESEPGGPQTSAPGQPGFGVVAVIIALLGFLVFRWR